MIIGRVPLMITSYWKPNICKYYLYYSLLAAAVRESLPIDYGNVHMNFVLTLNLAWACMYAFNFWRSTIAFLLFTGYVMVFCRFYLYQDDVPLMVLVAGFLVSCLWQVYTCAFVHIVISWVGLKFVEAEMPRESNERLLNNVREGVILIGVNDSKVMFMNNSAKMITKRIEEMSDFAILRNDNTIDVQCDAFCEVNYNILKATDVEGAV